MKATKCESCDGFGCTMEEDGYDECLSCGGTGWTDKKFRCQRCKAVIVGGVNAYGADDNTCLDCFPFIHAEWEAMKAAAVTR